MESIEALFNFMLSIFMCAVFALFFLALLFLGEGFVYGLRWLYLWLQARPRTTAEEFPGGDSCGEDAIDWKNRQS